MSFVQVSNRLNFVTSSSSFLSIMSKRQNVCGVMPFTSSVLLTIDLDVTKTTYNSTKITVVVVCCRSVIPMSVNDKTIKILKPQASFEKI